MPASPAAAEPLAGRRDQGDGAQELRQLVGAARAPGWRRRARNRRHHPRAPEARHRDSGRDRIREIKERVQQVHRRCSRIPGSCRGGHPRCLPSAVATVMPFAQLRKHKVNPGGRFHIYMGRPSNGDAMYDKHSTCLGKCNKGRSPGGANNRRRRPPGGPAPRFLTAGPAPAKAARQRLDRATRPTAVTPGTPRRRRRAAAAPGARRGSRS